MAPPQVRIVAAGAARPLDWTVYVDGKILPVVSARVKLDAGEIPTVLIELDDIEVEILGELRAAIARRRPTRFGDDLQDEIAKMLEEGASVPTIAARLIIPRNDVLAVQARLRRAAAEVHDRIDEQHAAAMAAEPVDEPATVDPPAAVETDSERRRIATDVRVWAEGCGLSLKSTGRIPRTVLEAYYYAHPHVPVPPDLQRRPFPPAPIGPSTSTVRAWARAVGMDVPDRGALAQRILDAYDAAHAAEPQQAAS